MRVQTFLIIDGFVPCTHSFPMPEKNGEKRAFKGVNPLKNSPRLKHSGAVRTARSGHPPKQSAHAYFGESVDVSLTFQVPEERLRKYASA